MDPLNFIPSVLPIDIVFFLEVMAPFLHVLIVGSVWLGITVPLLFVLFAASDVRLRRQPIFIFNVISVICGIIMGFLNVIVLTKSIQDPVHGVSRKSMMAYVVILLIVEFFVDAILLFRVHGVFPSRSTRKSIRFGIFVPIYLLKLARLTNILVFVVRFGEQINQIPLPEIAAVAFTHPEAKIGWILQLVDNAICSAIFLLKLRAGHPVASNRTTSSTGKIDSYGARLRALFWIATSNFVFPSLFVIALIVTTSVPMQEKESLLIVVVSNVYVEIIGVLFATVWIANKKMNYNEESNAKPEASIGNHSSVHFVPTNIPSHAEKAAVTTAEIGRTGSPLTYEVFEIQQDSESSLAKLQEQGEKFV